MSQMSEEERGQRERELNEMRLRELWKFLEFNPNAAYYLELGATEPPNRERAVVRLHPEGIGGPIEEWRITGVFRIKRFKGNERHGSYELYWLKGVSVTSPIVATWDGYTEYWSHVSVEDALEMGFDALELLEGMDEMFNIKRGHFQEKANRCSEGLGELNLIGHLGR